MVILLKKQKNFIAKNLRNKRFNQRVVKAKEGKGSYNRKK